MATSNVTSIVSFGDKFYDPVTDDVRQVFQLINYVILCGVISFFGIFANMATISVFVKQGFKDSINISLLGLAISDLICSATMFLTSIFYNPIFLQLDLPIEPFEVMCVTTAFPHVCFNRVTSFITAFITLERCLCIAMPLKVKNIITPVRTKVIIIFIYVFIILLFSPFLFANKLEWVYNPSQNRSTLRLTFTEDKDIVNGITYFIHSVFLSSALLLSVVICTIILVVKLNKKTKWRKTSVAQTDSKAETVSVKDSKVVKMVILIAAIFIVCYVPTTIIFVVTVFCPEYSMAGSLQNLLFVTWSVAFVLEAINSSVNFCVYYNMSTKFKHTFCEVFSCV